MSSPSGEPRAEDGQRGPLKYIVAAGIVVGLLVGLTQLYDRFMVPKPTPPPSSAPAPTGPAEFSGELSDHAGVTSFLAFIQDHDGEVVDLDISCIDDYESASCFAGPGVGDNVMMHLWLFTQDRCFTESEFDADYDQCGGSHVIWVQKPDGTSFNAANGPSGAGSVVLKGHATVRIQGYGGGVYPVTVRTIDLVPTD